MTDRPTPSWAAPVLAVTWRPGARAADRLVGAVLEAVVRRRLPAARLVSRLPDGQHPDGALGPTRARVPNLDVDPQGVTTAGPITLLADLVDGDLLARRAGVLRALGQLPEERSSVVIEAPDGVEVALRPGEVPLSLHGGRLAARAQGTSRRRLPDELLPVDLLAAVSASVRVVTDHPGLAGAALALGVELDWRGQIPPARDRERVAALVDLALGEILAQRLVGVAPEDLTAHAAAEAEVAERADRVDRELRRRNRALRDELADRGVAHEIDLARLEAAERRTRQLEDELARVRERAAVKTADAVRRLGRRR